VRKEKPALLRKIANLGGINLYSSARGDPMDLSGGARASKLTCDREAVHVVDEVDEAENDDGEPL